jgi:hypothetical protein
MRERRERPLFYKIESSSIKESVLGSRHCTFSLETIVWNKEINIYCKNMEKGNITASINCGVGEGEY